MLKQGDPLNYALLILNIEVFSRALNYLFDDSQYVCYGIPKWSANLNHLSNAHVIIIFVVPHEISLQIIMKVLERYESQSA